MKKKLGITLILALVLVLPGCHRGPTHITNLPVGVSETQVINWYSATANLKDMSTLVKGGADAVIALHNSNTLPGGDEYYQTVLGIFAKIGQAEEHSANILASTPRTFGTSTVSQLQTDSQIITAEFAKLTADKTLNTNSTTSAILQSLQLAVVAFQDIAAFRGGK